MTCRFRLLRRIRWRWFRNSGTIEKSQLLALGFKCSIELRFSEREMRSNVINKFD